MSDKPNESDPRALTKLQLAIDWAYRHGIEGIPGVSGAIDAGTTRAIAGAAKHIFTAIPSDQSTTT